MWTHKKDFNGDCARRGNEAESQFKELLIADGYTLQEPTLSQNMNNIDVIASKNGQTINIDIKAAKKISRKNDEVQNDLVWIECLSSEKKIGWCFNEILDYVAFDQIDSFAFVKRKDLAEFVSKNCDLKRIAFRPEDAVYKKYQRQGKTDCLTLIKGGDVRRLAKKIYQKINPVSI